MKLSMMIITLLCLKACGPHSSSGLPAKPMKPNAEKLKIDDDKETYMASLISLNVTASRAVSGAVTLHREGDFISAHVRINGSDPDVIHAQNIHVGTTCPVEAADSNLDGAVDAMEANLYTEGIMLPLDGDINSQYSLLNMYPVSDDWGSYVYSQSASYKLFMEDLASTDENPDDDIVKPAIHSFNFDGKVVMIQKSADNNQTIPVACGVLRRVWTIPGDFENDDATVGTTRVRPLPGPTPDRRNDSSTSPETRKPCVRTALGKDC